MENTIPSPFHGDFFCPKKHNISFIFIFTAEVLSIKDPPIPYRCGQISFDFEKKMMR